MGIRNKKFKPPPLQQVDLYPVSIMESIPKNHLVRVIDQLIDQLSIDFIMETYKVEGAAPYHPRLLLKVVLFAYCRGIFSYRAIAQAMRENIYFMYLGKGYQPCHKTIHNFLRGRLKDDVRKLFEQMIYYLHEEEYIDKSVFFVDGTIIRANANKHSHVWAKNTQRYKQGLYRKIAGLLDLAERINEEEDKNLGDLEVPEQADEISSEELREKARAMAERINNEQSDTKKRTLKGIDRRLEKATEKLEEYEEQEEKLGGRNSYSKTDPDATFLRDKSGNLVPSYNLQISTQHGFICHYTVSQTASDQRAFHDHLGCLPEEIQPQDYMGDAGYGSTSNYIELEKRGINAYLKDQYFYYHQTGKSNKNPFLKENFPYDKQTDTFTCPNDKKLVFHDEREKEIHNGEKIKIRTYICHDCADCPLRERCTRGKQRYIQVCETTEKYRDDARKNLMSEKGIGYRKRRAPDVEGPFGHIKHNAGCRRLRHRGLEGVTMEFGLLIMSYNLKKLAKKLEKAGFWLVFNLRCFLMYHRARFANQLLLN